MVMLKHIKRGLKTLLSSALVLMSALGLLVYLYHSGAWKYVCMPVIRDVSISGHDSFSVDIYTNSGDFWGEIMLIDRDESISYTDNSVYLFRCGLDRFEWIKYSGSMENGVVSIKWVDGLTSFAVGRMSMSEWQRMVKFTEEWRYGDKLITVIK